MYSENSIQPQLGVPVQRAAAGIFRSLMAKFGLDAPCSTPVHGGAPAGCDATLFNHETARASATAPATTRLIHRDGMLRLPAIRMKHP